MRFSLWFCSVLLMCYQQVDAETVARPSVVVNANNNNAEGNRRRPAPPPPRWLRHLKITPIALQKQQQTETTTAATPTDVSPVTTTSPHPSMQHHVALSKRTRNRFITSVAFLAGFVDALYFKKYETYATMMTGNVIRTAIMLAEFKFKKAFFFASLYIPYLLGHFVYRAKDLQMKTTNALREQLKLPKIPTYLAVIPYFLFAFVLCDVFPMNRSLALKMPLMAFGYSIINAAASDATSGVVTSAMTGHTEKLGLSLADYHFVDQKWRKGNKTSFRVILSFMIGIAVSTTGSTYVLPMLRRNGWPSFPLPFEMTAGLLHALVFQWYGNQWMNMQAMIAATDEASSGMTTATAPPPSQMEDKATSSSRRNVNNRVDTNSTNNNRGRNNNTQKEKKVAAPPRPTSHQKERKVAAPPRPTSHRERRIPPPARPKERKMPVPKRRMKQHLNEYDDSSEGEFA